MSFLGYSVVKNGRRCLDGFYAPFSREPHLFFQKDTYDPRNIEAKFKTLGLSMWSLALHGTFADSIAEILENMRALETVGAEGKRESGKRGP